ncbi:radixin [Clonorchis sinensis]|uniref:Radixin n=1 Tax=Clonorchis sinensis TaxID=79923 RepID=H2KTQ5_CLOSI|nr:radixin [Clonorchis sinensis]
MEERYLKMERAMQEQELAYEISQSALTDYQRKVKELEAQLEEEKRIHQELKDMQNHLEEVNRQLEMQSAASYDERARLAAERDAILAQIEQQRELIQAQEEEKRAIEAQLALGAQNRLNGDERRLSGEQELEALDNLRPDNERQAMAVTDIDYAKRLEIMRLELDPARDRNKLQQVDIRYEENISRGMDKYRTLHAIRQGNTKKRVEQFESM